MSERRNPPYSTKAYCFQGRTQVILFGDELTGALNSSTTREVLSIIDHINKKGTTVLIVTHDLNVTVHADKMIYLEDGRIMDTLNLGKYDTEIAEFRDAEMKSRLKKMRF